MPDDICTDIYISEHLHSLPAPAPTTTIRHDVWVVHITLDILQRIPMNRWVSTTAISHIITTVVVSFSYSAQCAHVRQPPILFVVYPTRESVHLTRKSVYLTRESMHKAQVHTHNPFLPISPAVALQPAAAYRGQSYTTKERTAELKQETGTKLQ